MKLTLTQFVALDGVYQGPGSPDEDTSDGFMRGAEYIWGAPSDLGRGRRGPLRSFRSRASRRNAVSPRGGSAPRSR